MKKKFGFLLSVIVIEAIIFTGCYQKETYVSIRDQNPQNEEDSLKIENDVAKRLENEEENNKKNLAVVNVTSLNFREKAGTEEKLLASIPQNTELEILSETEVDGVKWAKVKYKDMEGFVLLEYLKSK